MLLFDDFNSDPLAGPPSPLPTVNAIPGQHVLSLPLSPATRGVLLRLRGNQQTCQMILRTRSMGVRQGYRAQVTVAPDWRTLNLLLTDFQPFGGVLRRFPRPEAVYGYGIVATGPEQPQIDRVSFY